MQTRIFIWIGTTVAIVDTADRDRIVNALTGAGMPAPEAEQVADWAENAAAGEEYRNERYDLSTWIWK